MQSTWTGAGVVGCNFLDSTGAHDSKRDFVVLNRWWGRCDCKFLVGTRGFFVPQQVVVAANPWTAPTRGFFFLLSVVFAKLPHGLVFSSSVPQQLGNSVKTTRVFINRASNWKMASPKPERLIFLSFARFENSVHHTARISQTVYFRHSFWLDWLQGFCFVRLLPSKLYFSVCLFRLSYLEVDRHDYNTSGFDNC